MIDPRTLTDDLLIERIAGLARRERETSAELIDHLVELERRNLHLACGFKSLFGYCRRVLHCSEAAAYDRMGTAHAARRFPVVLALLAGGQLHATAVRLLAPHLKGHDHLALLGGAFYKSTKEVRELLARWFPQPDVAQSVRKLPTPLRAAPAGTGAAATRAADTNTDADDADAADTGAADAEAADAEAADADAVDARTDLALRPPSHANTSGTGSGGSGSSGPSSPGAPPSPNAAPRKDRVDALAAGRYAVRFTADEETVCLLREAQELLSHSVRDADIAVLMKRGLRLLVEDARRQRFSATERPGRPRSVTPSSKPERGRSAAVERAVWTRDGGQCAFIGRDGRRCEERRCLQYHHLKPWIVGGPQTVENLALRCAAHNRYEAHVYLAPIRRGMQEQ